MAGEADKVGTGYVAPSSDVQSALEMPIEQLEAQIASQGNVQTPQSNPDLQTKVAPNPVLPTDGQATKDNVVNKAEAQPVPSETVQTEVNPVTFESLQQKIGIKSPDALAKSYTEAVRELQKMKQLEAEKRRMEQQIPTQPVIPQASQDSNFLNRLLENPEMTIAEAYLKMNEITSAQQREMNAPTERKLKFLEMASSPETADFASDEIQRQMIEELKTKPEWAKSQSEVNSHLDELYWIAKGKVARTAELKALEEGRKQGQQSVLQRKAGLVESAGSVATPTTGAVNTDPNTMPLPDLEALILKQLQG
jgi:hypothetical protein